MTDLWLGPDLIADLVPLVDHLEQWPVAHSRCAMVQMFSQQMLANHEGHYGVGVNYRQRLIDRGFFRLLDVPLAFEVAGLKNWNPGPGSEPPQWTAESLAYSVAAAKDQLGQIIDTVRVAGGDVTAVSLDDPLTAAYHDYLPALSLDVAAEAMRTVMHEAWIRGVKAGWTEAYPSCTPEQIIACAERISPAHLHLDIDEQHAKQLHSDAKIAADLTNLLQHCRAWGIPLRIIINGQRGNTPTAYRTGFWEWFNFVRRMLGDDPDGYVLESWKSSDPAIAAANPDGLPVNLPETSQFSHTGLLREVAATIGGG